MHPGDIPHRIFNGLRRDNPYDLVHIWEDDSGDVVAWTLLDPRGAGYDAQVSPVVRGAMPGLEREVDIWSEETLLTIMQERGSEARAIETEAFSIDTVRTALLEHSGWIAQPAERMMLTRRSLDDVPDPALPSGYKVRTVRGVEEAGPVSELHSAGFGSSWTPQLYRRVMESPGYDKDRELLIEAPDGSLAGFCVTWPDETNRTGLFEPVAVHPDHRRRRLGGALMRAGMRLMRESGMEWAEVMYEVDNPGSEALYRAEGFVPLWEVLRYRKPVRLDTR
ncbi:MAG: GNAT family N-acetyltransferase [Actinomycetota bacterium]|nr:GNAT family N-acetyltransferase [Actinomycetota bacterium]